MFGLSGGGFSAGATAMVPRKDVPRSTFKTKHTHKTTFGSGTLIPVLIDEVMPGDTHQITGTLFGRLANLLFPMMDNVYLESFGFFVPMRLVWTNSVKMFGERKNPSDSISYGVPQLTFTPANLAAGQTCTLPDYMGMPIGQITGNLLVNALPFRAYNLIWNEWFRDENLQNQVTVNTSDSGDTPADFTLLRRNKRKDYFTGSLPWPLKGGVDVSLPLTGPAYIRGIAVQNAASATAGGSATAAEYGGGVPSLQTGAAAWPGRLATSSAGNIEIRTTSSGTNTQPYVWADMSTTTGATINALRLAFQTQRLLELDARSGTRYTELVTAHFGVRPQDMRLQRPEYIGGGRTNVETQAIPYTSVDRNQTTQALINPVGALSAAATATGRHHFTYNATEHGYIIILLNLTADLTYQQGVHRMWTRQTRYDFPWPVFANLGEQVVRNDEIYAIGVGGTDTSAFGYQERYAEYRVSLSRISGLFRSQATGTIDPWHLSQKFTALPVLNTSFIQDQPPLSRALAAGAAADNMQMILDSLWDMKRTRPLPVYGVPGNIDRF